MNISIAIADLNKEYVERLLEVLQQYDELTIHVYTNWQKLQTAMDGGRFDVVLFDPDICEERLGFSKVKLPVCLYSDEARGAGLYPDTAKVLKYQRISGIYKEMIRAYAEKAGYSADFDHSQSTSVAVVYSPVGGSGKTTVALALASRLASQGMSVLFMSAEQLDSSGCVNPHSEDGIITLIQAAADEQVNFPLTVKGVRKQGLNNMFYIEGFQRLADYDAVTDKEMSDVFDKIRRSGICDVLVVDMETNLNAVGRAVASQADTIVVVERPGELPAAKMDLFARQVFANEHSGKMVRVFNFAENNSKFSQGLDRPVAGTIHNYGNLPLKNVIQAINMNNELQTEIIIRK